MADASAHTQQPEQYTSDSVRRLVNLADGMLTGDASADEVESVLDRLTESLDELSDAEREQIEELTRLLKVDPSRQADAEKLAQPAEFAVTTAEDRMSMSLSIRPAMGGGASVTVKQVLKWLKQRKISKGVDREAIEQAVAEAAEGRKVESVVIVRGAPPTEGTGERVVLYGRPSTDDELVEVDLPADGAVSDTHMCLEGDVILKKVSATPGEPGYTATGHPLEPPQPPTVSITSGPNVQTNGDRCVATVGGLVIYEGGRIEVRRMLVIDKDITANQKAVHFDGDVQVRAAVRSGATLTATGNITVDGSVEAATIESTGGNVDLRHGVTGGHEGLIKAAGSISARFAENVTLMAGDDIVVDIGALHSRLTAGGAIRLVRGRGQMIGGSALAGDLIELKQGGSSSGVRTELCVGLGRKAMEAMAGIDTQIARLQVKGEEAEELAEKIRRTVGDPTHLQPAELKTYTSLRQVQLVCGVKMRELRAKRDEVLAEAAEQSGGRIDVAVSLMPQVVVHIGDAEMVVDQPQHRCRLVYNPDRQTIDVQGLR